MAGKHIGHGHGGGWAKEGSSERNPYNDQSDVPIGTSALLPCRG